MSERRCVNCGVPLTRPRVRYCDYPCRRMARNRRQKQWRRENPEKMRTYRKRATEKAEARDREHWEALEPELCRLSDELGDWQRAARYLNIPKEWASQAVYRHRARARVA